MGGGWCGCGVCFPFFTLQPGRSRYLLLVTLHTLHKKYFKKMSGTLVCITMTCDCDYLLCDVTFAWMESCQKCVSAWGPRSTIHHHHHHHHQHHHRQSLNREGRWGTIDDLATSFLYFSLFSTTLWDLPNSRPVHSLMLSSHLFLFRLVFFPLSLCLAQ